MTVLPQVVNAWVELVQAELPRVQVTGEPPAEDATTTSVYLDAYESTFDWMCLGDPAAQEERIRLSIVAQAYKSKTSQRDAARTARERLFDLLDGVQRGVMNVGDPHAHQLSGRVSLARIARWQVRFAGAEKGWVAVGRSILEATYWP